MDAPSPCADKALSPCCKAEGDAWEDTPLEAEEACEV